MQAVEYNGLTFLRQNGRPYTIMGSVKNLPIHYIDSFVRESLTDTPQLTLYITDVTEVLDSYPQTAIKDAVLDFSNNTSNIIQTDASTLSELTQSSILNRRFLQIVSNFMRVNINFVLADSDRVCRTCIIPMDQREDEYYCAQCQTTSPIQEVGGARDGLFRGISIDKEMREMEKTIDRLEGITDLDPSVVEEVMTHLDQYFAERTCCPASRSWRPLCWLVGGRKAPAGT